MKDYTLQNKRFCNKNYPIYG